VTKDDSKSTITVVVINSVRTLKRLDQGCHGKNNNLTNSQLAEFHVGHSTAQEKAHEKGG
jgi:hypothetical protein